MGKKHSFTANSGRKYVGLDTISMSKTDLIMFFGCNTATEDSNLCTASVDKGAKVAVGTSQSVVSRAGEGATWVQRFIDGLYNGKSVIQAGAYADKFVSASNCMRTGWTYEGKGSTIVNPSTKKITLETEGVNALGALDASFVEETVDIHLGELDDHIISGNATVYAEELGDVVSYLRNIDGSFDLSDYNISTKKFADGQGILSLEYSIGEDISTEKGFTFVYADGSLISVTYNRDLYSASIQKNASIDEKYLIDTVNEHKANIPTVTAVDNSSVFSNAYYTFDYASQKLMYTVEKYVFDGEVWKGTVVEEQLNKK